jgi:transposase/flavodoxin
MENTTKERIEKMIPLLNEKSLRQYLALEAKGIGHGGISEISKLTGVSRTTITLGSKETEQTVENTDTSGIRKKGGGRKKVVERHADIKGELEKLLDSDTFGNPENPLRWTTKSLRNLSDELKRKGFNVSHVTVGKILESMEYSLQANKKCLQIGDSHVDRNAQFEHINAKVLLFINEKQPVISVDTKKKENIGNFKNSGAEYCPKGSPNEVLDHDFPVKELGSVRPYGIYDINNNTGYVNLGISSDTAEFAVQSIQNWWEQMGKEMYPLATKLYITCDSGGSNGSRTRLWKIKLQEFALKSGLDVHISHFPPGTSKWNKIEHRMFCFISKNWRGKPLISTEVVVNLIASTTTAKGLKIMCEIDNSHYEKGIKVSDDELQNINIIKADFHGDWNYNIKNSVI